MEEKKLLRAKKFNQTPNTTPSNANPIGNSSNVIMTASGPVTRKKKGPNTVATNNTNNTNKELEE